MLAASHRGHALSTLTPEIRSMSLRPLCAFLLFAATPLWDSTGVWAEEKPDCLSRFREDWRTALPTCEARLQELEVEKKSASVTEQTSLSLYAGFIYQSQGAPDMANKYYEKALSNLSSDSRNNIYARASAFDRMGDLLASRNDFTRALNYYKDALTALDESPPALDQVMFYDIGGHIGFFPGAVGPTITEVPHVYLPIFYSYYDYKIVDCLRMVISMHATKSYVAIKQHHDSMKSYVRAMKYNKSCGNFTRANAVADSFRLFSNQTLATLPDDQRGHVMGLYREWIEENTWASALAVKAARIDHHILSSFIAAAAGNTAMARGSLATAEALANSAGDSLAGMLGNIYAFQARFEIENGRYDEAVMKYRRAVQRGYFADIGIHELPGTDLTRSIRAVRSTIAQSLYSSIFDRLDGPSVFPTLWDVILQNKGVTLDASRRFQRTYMHFQVGISRDDFHRRLHQLDDEISRLSLAPAIERTAEERQGDWQALSARRSALVAAAVPGNLRQLLASVAGGSPEVLSGQVVAALPPSGALVEVVQVHKAGRYLAVVVNTDGGMHAVDLGPTAEIDRQVSRFLSEVARAAPGFEQVAQQVYGRIFAPLMPWLGDSQHIYLSLDGALSLLPFSALHDGEDYLIDKYNFYYLNSGRDLVGTETPQSLAPPVLIANPALVPSGSETNGSPRGTEYRRGQVCRLRERARGLPPLPGAESEAKAIAALLPRSRLLYGAAATEAALRGLVAPRILHIAAHAEYAARGPATVSAESAKPRSALTPIPTLLPSGTATLGAELSEGGTCPMFESALLLTGAASQSGVGQAVALDQDGLLTADEVRNYLNLWGTELVVLSACQTGVGATQPNEGVFGLRRAFFLAGARSLVTSQWSVDDEATHQLMVAFYRHLLSGQPRGTALQHAMSETRQRKPHPFYWAPFIFIGKNAPLSLTDSSGPSID